VVIAQHYGWQGIPELVPDSGLFFNRVIAAEGAAMALVLVVGYRLWWVVPGILPSVGLGSRSAILATTIAGVFALWQRSRIAAAGAVVAAIAVLVVYTEVNFNGIVGTDDITMRLGAWYDAMHGMTFAGSGLGSFIVDFPLYQVHTNALQLRWENAHNDIIQLTFELGIVGAFLCALALAKLYTSPSQPERYALIVFVALGLVGFPLYEPFTGALAALCAGFLFSRGDSILLHIAGGGLRIWDGLAHRQSGILHEGFGAVSLKPGQAVGAGLCSDSGT